MKKLIQESKSHVQERAIVLKSKTKGFGLIEFVCATAILGILIVLGIWQFFRITESFKINEAQKYSSRLTIAAKNFEIDTGRIPKKLNYLVEFSGIQNWNGPYINMEKFIDPWGEPFFVTNIESEILVTSSNLQARIKK